MLLSAGIHERIEFFVEGNERLTVAAGKRKVIVMMGKTHAECTPLGRPQDLELESHLERHVRLVLKTI